VTRRIGTIGDSGDVYEFETPSWSDGRKTYTLLLFKCDGKAIIRDPDDGHLRTVKGEAGDIYCPCKDYVCRLKAADILDASKGCKHTRALHRRLRKKTRGLEVAQHA
jgi:hypothetical protein